LNNRVLSPLIILTEFENSFGIITLAGTISSSNSHHYRRSSLFETWSETNQGHLQLTKRESGLETHSAIQDLDSIPEKDLEFVGHYSNSDCDWSATSDPSCLSYFIYNHPNRLHNQVSRIVAICKNDPGSKNGLNWNYLEEFDIQCCDTRNESDTTQTRQPYSWHIIENSV